jgi:hypothetical protein
VPQTLRAQPCLPQLFWGPLQPMLLECNLVGAWRMVSFGRYRTGDAIRGRSIWAG